MNKINVLLINPGEHPKRVEIDGDLKSLQAAVDGYIEVVYPFKDPVAVICNEEGKLRNLPLNRGLRDESGQLYDIISGSFLVVGLGEEDVSSLSPEMMVKYERLFYHPEVFINLNDKILCFPSDDNEGILRAVCRKMGIALDPDPDYDTAIDRMKEFYPKDESSKDE